MSTEISSPKPAPVIASGARPVGAEDETAAAEMVREMFDTIAPKYDVLNHVLSAGIDHLWWARAARALKPILVRPAARVMDLCCGTGDMTLALYKHRPAGAEAAPMLAVDFSHPMLARGRDKFVGLNILAIEADAFALPTADNSLDLITAAFGFRNLANYTQGLAELYRALRPGGEIAILECNQPEGLTGELYNLYFKQILPRVGGMISGTASAYTYLPESVERFPRPPKMLQLIAEAGFTGGAWTSYTLGVAGLYRATKP